MTNKTKLICLLLLLASISTISYANSKKFKFGKVPEELLKMKTYDKDTSAVAVILYDSGYSYFEYENNETNSGFVCKFERHVRLKILKKEGFDYATFKIPVYHSKSGKEEVSTLKARTFNFDGKVVQTKLEKKQIFKEETSSNWTTVKFTMPNIKVGSVIDCKYIVKTPFFHNFRTWNFQYNIPVAYSVFRTQILEYFNYQKTIKGYFPVNEVNLDHKQESINVEYKQMSTRAGSVKMERHKFTLNPYSDITEYWAKDIPAFTKESYMLAEENYLSRVEFELESYKIEDGPLKRYSSTWKTVQEKLLKSENFGQELKRLGFAEKIISSYINADDAPKDKVTKLYQLVQNKLVWNEKHRLFCSNSLKNIWKEKKGNSADINLMLVALLRSAKIKANPVVLSTRQNGLIHPSHPTLTQMNYVIACAELEGGKYLMDATDPFCPIGILPFKCLNEQGRIISEYGSEWISLTPHKGSKINFIADLKVNEEGNLTGNIKEVFLDYANIDKRKKIGSKPTEFINEFEAKNEDWNISNTKLLNADNRFKPLTLTYSTELENVVNMEGDRMYLNPVIKYQTTNNPFKMEKRDYPVHFGHPISLNYMLVLQIPEGFKIEEQPSPSLVKLPENSGSYSYRITQTGNKIMANFKFNIKRTHFIPNEYEVIKEFYNQVIKQENQVLILKKDETTAIK